MVLDNPRDRPEYTIMRSVNQAFSAAVTWSLIGHDCEEAISRKVEAFMTCSLQ